MNITKSIAICVATFSVFGLAACGSDDDDAGIVATVEADARAVEQEIHDDVVAAYEASKSAVESAEASVSDVTRATYDELASALDSIGDKIAGAESEVGDVARRAYREIEHDTRTLARKADQALHLVGHDIEAAEQAAWHSLQDAWHAVADFATHAVDSLF